MYSAYCESTKREYDVCGAMSPRLFTMMVMGMQFVRDRCTLGTYTQVISVPEIDGKAENRGRTSDLLGKKIKSVMLSTFRTKQKHYAKYTYKQYYILSNFDVMTKSMPLSFIN